MKWSGPLFPGHKCSLGYGIADWLLENVCHGPGDLQGQFPITLDDEMLEFIVEAYEIDPETGKKIFDEGVLSRPKGRAKTEIAGWLAIAEAYGPVRFSHWDENGEPVAKPVVSPLIKCLATEESQATASFSVVAFIVEWGKEHKPDVYTGSTGVRAYQSATAIYLPMPNGGEIRATTSGAASKDGGKETFVICDESHLYVLPELKNMYGTIRRNLGKRRLAEPWMLQTTTAYRPGEQSIAEETLTAWRKETLSKVVYVNHREAKGRIDIKNENHTMAQLRYVYGAATAWMDLDRIYREMLDPRSCPDDATAARYFLNRAMSTKDAWIAKDIVERQIRPADSIAFGEHITIGFDGSLNEDTTVLRGCRMSDGFRFRIGAWAKPDGAEGIGWEVPRPDVLATIHETYERYNVVMGYFDPHEWRSDIDALAEKYPERVVSWDTHRDVAMGNALDRLHADMVNGVTFQDTDPLALEHYGNTYVRYHGKLRLVRKEYPNSPRKIDTVVGDALAYEARADALTAGWVEKPAVSVPRRIR